MAFFDAATLCHAVILIFDTLTLKVRGTSSVTWSKSVQNLSEIEQFPAELLGLPTLVGKALSFTHELYLFLFYQSTVLSSHAEDGHQMYFGGSFVDKASTIGIEISATLP